MAETSLYALPPPPSHQESEHNGDVDSTTGAVIIKEETKVEKGFITKLKSLRQEKLARPTAMSAYCSIDFSKLSISEVTLLRQTIPSLGIKISKGLSTEGYLQVTLYDIDKFNVEFHKKNFDYYYAGDGHHPEGLAYYHLKFTSADF